MQFSRDLVRGQGFVIPGLFDESYEDPETAAVLIPYIKQTEGIAKPLEIMVDILVVQPSYFEYGNFSGHVVTFVIGYYWYF